MAMRHGGGEERPNVSRSAVESGEAARDEAPSAVAGGCLSPRWKCGRLHGSECSAETGADERPLIAVSAGNFNTALLLQDHFSNPVDLKVVAFFLRQNDCHQGGRFCL